MEVSRKPRAKPIETMIRRVKRTSIGEDIAKQIMDLIGNGSLKPGQRLPSERELCEHFGASRSSLREALRCLSIVGVLNARVGEGTSVALDGGKFMRRIMEWRMITEQTDIVNLLEIRIALESVSAASTALHGTEDDINELHRLLAKMKASLKDPKQFAVLDLEFHVALAIASRNTMLSDFVSVIRNQLGRTVARVLLLPDAIPLSYKEHVSIVTAIERHDPDAARRAMHSHLNAALERYSKATKTGRISDNRFI